MHLRPTLLGFCFITLIFLVTTPVRGDVPIFGDSFKNTAPDHAHGSPVDGAKLERGHGRWKGTSGLYFDDGKVKGGGVAEHARFAFHPEQHQRSARVYFEAWLDPGSNGWSGIGFTNGEDGPLPNVGQLWMKIDDRGRIEVRADGASNKLYKDSHTHPAFVEGENLIRIEYNRRLNTARAWLNKVELPLGPLDKHGFVPDIQAVALQLRDNGGHLKGKSVGGSGAGGTVVGLVGALIGDQFNVVLPNLQGRHEGDPLNDVATQFGGEVWWANSDTGFGPGYATNIDLGPAVALAPFDPADHPGYAESSVEAIVNPGDASWLALGFAANTNWSLKGSGTIWVQLFPSGAVRVRSLGTSQILYDGQPLDPGVFAGGLPVKLTFNRLTGATRVDFGEAELAIPSINVTVPAASLPLATVSAGFHAARGGGFTDTNQFAVDDFAVRLSGEILPLEITDEPADQTQVYGGLAEFHCAAGGGVAPYSYRWQQGRPGISFPVKGLKVANLMWSDIEPDISGFSGIDTQDLVIGPVMSAHNGYYRCVATDSNSIPSEAASNSADLTVLEPIFTDSFTTGASTGRAVGSLLNGQATETGDGLWHATGGAILGNDNLTNQQQTSIHLLAEVPVSSAMISTYRILSTSANVLVDDADWVGVGFSTSGLDRFFSSGSGQLWVQVLPDGKAIVRADTTVLFNQYVLDPGRMLEPVHVRVDYNTETQTARAWVDNKELTLPATGSLGEMETAGINGRMAGGYGNDSVFSIDDFALTGSEEIPAPSFVESPLTQSVKLGDDVTLTCTVDGGVSPYSFQWSRSGEEITTNYQFTITAQDNTSTLEIADFDPSLEGRYVCQVLDSRYGDDRPAQALARLGSSLPDFRVLWGGRATDNLFVANAYANESQTTTVDWLREGSTYYLEVVVSGENVSSDLLVPVEIWGTCHAPGVEITSPERLLGSTTVAATTGHVRLPITIPEDCVPSGDWGLLTLMADINAELDPERPTEYPGSVDGGQPHLAENGFCFDNRGTLHSWIPVSATGSAADLGLDSIYADFKTTQDPPTTGYYPEEWTNATLRPDPEYQWNCLEFSLVAWQPCVWVDEAIPDPYQPYLAWDTGRTDDISGVMTRYRVHNPKPNKPEQLYVGVTHGEEPPSPGISLEDPIETPGDAAKLGASASSSVNQLSWANNRQFHVLVWANAGGPFFNSNPGNHLDGVGSIEIPDFAGAQPTVGNTTVYLGFEKDMQQTYVPYGQPCVILDREFYYVDFIRAFTYETVGPPQGVVDDYQAIDIVQIDGDGFPEIPDTVHLNDSYRVCVEVQANKETLPPPESVEIRFGYQCGVDGEPSYSSGWIATVPSGTGQTTDFTYHCLAVGSEWVVGEPPGDDCPDPTDYKFHLIQGELTDADDDDSGNNEISDRFAVDIACMTTFDFPTDVTE